VDIRMKKPIKIVIDFVIATLFGALIAILFMEWWVGCGESYVDAYGKRHMNECLFLNL
jgi:hypothetical protein